LKRTEIDLKKTSLAKVAEKVKTLNIRKDLDKLGRRKSQPGKPRQFNNIANSTTHQFFCGM